MVRRQGPHLGPYRPEVGALSAYSTQEARDPSGSLVSPSYRSYVLVMGSA
ncbi:MAG: hypothetical protein ACYC1E_07760 [Propionibacteriaceae bacterium]